MTAIEQAEDLRQQAIAILVKERDEIEVRLTQLGFGNQKSPGRQAAGQEA